MVFKGMAGGNTFLYVLNNRERTEILTEEEILAVEGVTAEAGSLLEYFTTLTKRSIHLFGGGSYLGVHFFGVVFF